MKSRIRNFAALSLAVAFATTAVFTTSSAASRSKRGSKIAVKGSSVSMMASALTAPNLGAAGVFAVLGASTVTSANASRIAGDLGLSPGISVTGFPPGILVGTLHVSDSTAAQAQLDLTAAYNDAAGRTLDAIALAGNLGGQTLAPGLYKSTSSLEISSGDLTLDAQGNADAVFIFQMASTLVTTTGRKVILAGGAQPANIYWQVGSSATLGVNSVFKGNILALASITATSGASVDGRLLARTAAVTLDGNTVVRHGSVGAPPVDPIVVVPSPPMGGLVSFEILAGSTVTNTGATTVTGNLGVSPGTAVTGFLPGILVGTLHAGDPTAALAQVALTAAYNDAAGRTLDAIVIAGNLGGQTLAPGLYKSTSSLEISSGDLTLDAKGNANAVFIFQMGSTLVTTTGRKVILVGGAQAANIIWQVGSSATLGVSSVFKGNILAMASITVNNGASVEGRLLARTGAVTLDSNVARIPVAVFGQPVTALPSKI